MQNVSGQVDHQLVARYARPLSVDRLLKRLHATADDLGSRSRDVSTRGERIREKVTVDLRPHLIDRRLVPAMAATSTVSGGSICGGRVVVTKRRPSIWRITSNVRVHKRCDFELHGGSRRDAG